MVDYFFLVFFGALLFSLILTPLVRDWAVRMGIVDRGLEKRKIHRQPTPRIGGVAIFGAFITATGILYILAMMKVVTLDIRYAKEVRLLMIGACVFALGLLDDRYNLHPRFKLLFQILCGLLAYSAGFSIRMISMPFMDNPIGLGIFSLPLTVLWFVAITNAFNLIDGLDGLSAGLGIIAGTVMFFVSIATDHMMEALISAALVGSLLGFLRYNFHPATIFMGDGGSLFIGFILAGLAITGSQKSSTAIVIFIPFLIFAVPIADTVVSFLRRLISGKPVFGADREHIHHKLLDLGMKQQQIVILLYGIAAFFGFYSLIFFNPGSRFIGYSLLVIFIFLVLAIQKIGYDEFRELFKYVMLGLRIQGRQLSSQIQVKKLFSYFQNNGRITVRQFFSEFTEVVDQIGFDYAKLTVHSIAGTGKRPVELVWKREAFSQDRYAWQVTMPLCHKSRHFASLTLAKMRSDELLASRLSLIVQEIPAYLENVLIKKCIEMQEEQSKVEELVHP